MFEDVRRLLCWLATGAVWMLRRRCELPVVSELVLHQKKEGSVSKPIVFLQFTWLPVGEVFCSSIAKHQVTGIHLGSVRSPSKHYSCCLCEYSRSKLFSQLLYISFLVWIDALLCLKMLLSERQALSDGSTVACWHYHRACLELDNVLQYWVTGQHEEHLQAVPGKTELMFTACCSQSLQSESSV